MHLRIKDGVTLDLLPTKQFKTVGIKVDFVTPLRATAITARALLAQVLETSTAAYPTQTALARQLSAMYGANFGITVLKAGTQHIVRLTCSVVDEQYLTSYADTQPLFERGMALLQAVLFDPLLPNGHFDPTTFTQQRQNLLTAIKSLDDDKQYLANRRLQELLFAGQPTQAMSALGDITTLGELTAADILTTYHDMLAHDAVHVAVIGDVTAERAQAALTTWPLVAREVHETLPYYQWEARPTVQVGDDVAPVTQAKLNLAYRVPVYRNDADFMATVVFNAVFGGTPLSLLFTNVREKASLAYYASSSYSPYTGTISVQTGIQAQNQQRVLTIIAEQLATLQRGELSADLLAEIKASLRNARLTVLDSPQRLLDGRLNAQLTHVTTSLADWQAALDAVTVADVQRVAQRVTLQATYCLHGGED
ncbi:EF-P 5-aminopentanol modification-associated protein YfmF [Levilactobacillus acidifarinae]|uniref:Zn-dependent peptidase n=1 Tax=Levilactobacillus acidifarinae DSM 19394 = JCM 15949 TaxID=1423715 RepID=A0A0R1LDC6_9LACO|nr:pitrilysin family protein [Levilactobacillus acidifarinae]KRK93755.1 Zn-dependent peptidase [Levilactobacillus acidifarinae DSM 19394]GEO68639.1 peptidase M16 [Levilactobacillus acidifarinae]